MTLTAPRVATLDANDRCDACASGAERAYVLVSILGATGLLFCGHHYDRHKPVFDSMNAAGLSVMTVDERWQLEGSR